MTKGRAIAILIAVAATPIDAGPVVTPNYDTVDTSRWRCRLCPFDLATAGHGHWRLGALAVDEAESRFGRDNGLDHAGIQGNGNVVFAHRGAEGRHFGVEGVHLGRDDRRVRLRAGRDEGYDVVVRWRELPRNVAADGRTPYTGRTTLALPDTWASVGAGSLGTMQGRAVDNATRRRRGHARLALMPTRNVRLQASYSHEAKAGTAETYADRFYQATGLPKPIKYATEELGGEVAFTSQPWLVAAALRRSRFRNADASLAWQDAFAPHRDPTRVALAPDNGLDTLSLVSRTRLGRTRFSAQANWGRHRQDDALLPATTNAALDAAGLDAHAFDGRARTFAGTANLVTRLTARLRLSLAHRLHERADRTRPVLFTPVLGDLFETTPRPNRAYSVRRAATEAALRYRLGSRTSLAFGGRSVRAERTRLEITDNRERVGWVDIAARWPRGLGISAKLSQGERKASAFQASTRNNPLTRRFYQAAREESILRVRVDNRTTAMPVTIGAEVDMRVTTYPASTLGLTRTEDAGWSADASYAPAASVLLSAFVESRASASTTAGQQAYPTAHWRYATADDVRTAGLVARAHGVLHADLDLALTYHQSLGRGRYETVVSDNTHVFPDIVSDHRSLAVEATYRWRPKTALIAHWYWEDYRGADWALADVAPARISNVLAFGRRAPAYTNSFLALALERRL